MNRLNITKLPAIAYILFLAAALRLATLSSLSLWYDEALTALCLNLPFMEMVKDRLAAGHSPFYFAILFPLIKVFGNNEFVLRLPSALASIFSIYLIYIFTKRMLNEKTALFAALFMSLSALDVYFAQEARMYSLCVMTVLLSYYYLYKAMDEDDWKLWLGHFLASVSSLYFSAITLPILLAQIPYVAFKKKKAGDFYISFVSALLFYMPMIAFYLRMKKLGFVEWVQGINFDTLINIIAGFSFYPVPMNIPYPLIQSLRYSSLFLAGGLVVFGLVITWRTKKEVAVLLGSWLFTPLILETIYSIFKQPLLGPKRYVIAIAPAFFILLAAGLNSIKGKKLFAILVTSLIVLYSALLFGYYLTPTRENWRGAIKHLDVNMVKGEVLYGDYSTHTMNRYYGNDKDRMMIDIRFITTGLRIKGWFLIRKMDFVKMFPNEKQFTKQMKASPEKEFSGLKLFRLKP